MPRDDAQTEHALYDDGGAAAQVPAAFLCPILQDVMRDPVITARALPRDLEPGAMLRAAASWRS